MRRLLLSLALLASIVSQAERLEGTAKNNKGDIVYFEKHTIETDQAGLNKFIRVEYSKADGSKFATMTSDFSESKMVPNTTFEDERIKTKSSMRLLNGEVQFEEFKDGKSISKKTIPLQDSMVAGQGFDNFIRINFDKLEAKSIEFEFGVLERQDFFSLTGYKKPSGASGDLEFGIKASSWLVRFFAEELKVSYDAKSKKLKSFAGRSNILDESGKSQDVVITYKWIDDRKDGP